MKFSLFLFKGIYLKKETALQRRLSTKKHEHYFPLPNIGK